MINVLNKSKANITRDRILRVLISMVQMVFVTLCIDAEYLNMLLTLREVIIYNDYQFKLCAASPEVVFIGLTIPRFYIHIFHMFHVCSLCYFILNNQKVMILLTNAPLGYFTFDLAMFRGTSTKRKSSSDCRMISSHRGAWLSLSFACLFHFVLLQLLLYSIE